MSATEGNKHILAAQKSGKPSSEALGAPYLKHLSSENIFFERATKNDSRSNTWSNFCGPDRKN